VRQANVTTLYRALDVAAIMDGAQVLLDDGTYRVLSLNSSSASAWWGRDTRWCTTGAEWFARYRTYGELLYIEHRQSKRRWQLYLPKCEFRTARNRRANGHVFARQHPAVLAVLQGRLETDPRTQLLFGVLVDGVRIDHSLSLRCVPLQSLPARLTVRDDLDLRATGIRQLPEGLKVGGNLFLSARVTPKIPHDLEVRGRIICCDRDHRFELTPGSGWRPQIAMPLR
jgi:hypothetical protein